MKAPKASWLTLVLLLLLTVLPLLVQAAGVHLRPERTGSPVVSFEAGQSVGQPTHTLNAGLWRIDAGFQSTIRIRNELVVAPLDVTPVLYMSDGTAYDLPPVHIAAGGVTTVDIDQAIASLSKRARSQLSDFGSAALRYQYAEPGHLAASIDMLNVSASLNLVTAFNGVDSHNTGRHVIEGLWWRRDSGVGGFVALTNVTSKAMRVTIDVDEAADPKSEAERDRRQGRRDRTDTSLHLSAHSLRMISLNDVVNSDAHSSGGIRIEYEGDQGSVMVTGGLLNWQEGYSASIPFLFHDDDMASSTDTAITYASTGIMSGLTDPMMEFPRDTRFVPYVVLRNTTTKTLPVTLSLNWMSPDGTPLSRVIPTVALRPGESEQIDGQRLLEAAGLSAFNGDLNFSLSFVGHHGDLLLATGSVDQSGSYVFEVEPQGIGATNSKQVAFWTAADGFDTMYSIWNPIDQPQDLLLHLYYGDGSGSYTLPIHLAGKASTMVDLAMLRASGQRDVDGHTLSAMISNGSAIIESAAGRKTPVTLVVSGGTYNVKTATCGAVCITCCGYNQFGISPSDFSLGVGESLWCSLHATDCNGNTFEFSGNWSSDDPSVMSIDSSGFVTGIAGGSTTIWGQFNPIDVVQGQFCSTQSPVCPLGQPRVGTQGAATATVQVSAVTVTPSAIKTQVEPRHATITVSVFHQPLSGTATVTVNIGTFSSDPAGIAASYVPTSQSLTLAGGQGNQNVQFDVTVPSIPGPSASVTVAATLSNASTGLMIVASPPPNFTKLFTVTVQ